MAAFSIPRKTAMTIAIFAAMLVALPYVPGPKRFSGFNAAQIERAFSLAPAAKPVATPPAAPTIVAAKTIPAAHKAPEVPNLSVPPGSLDTFFDSLRKRGVTRVLHYGDSPTTADSITSDIRRLFQARFGDAGHGFLLIAKPWAWYGHNGISLDAKGWRIEPASQNRAPDGIHGLGGVSFRGETGAWSRVKLPDAQHTRATVYYLEQPGGGTFSVHTGDGLEIASAQTAGETKQPAFAEFALPPGTESIELRVTAGQTRLFGYRFDKPGPGVQYSSLGVNGAQVQMMMRYFETSPWTAALRHENPDLVVLNYGTNESVYPAYIDKQYPDELRTVIGRIRAALPHASLLVMSPMDRGAMEGADIVTPPALEKLIAVQQRIAAETGCAFFNTFEAMGGAGTMGRWYRMQPRLVSADFMHPLPQGAAKVGALFEGALVTAFEATGR